MTYFSRLSNTAAPRQGRLDRPESVEGTCYRPSGAAGLGTGVMSVYGAGAHCAGADYRFSCRLKRQIQRQSLGGTGPPFKLQVGVAGWLWLQADINSPEIEVCFTPNSGH